MTESRFQCWGTEGAVSDRPIAFHQGPGPPEGERAGFGFPLTLDRPARSPLAILPVVALAALLRLYALPQRGFIYWDEAKLALEGVRMLGALHALAGGALATTTGKEVGTAKPTHALLIALAYALLGVRDQAPLLLDAVSSLGGVILTYLIGRRLFSPAVGLLASLFLAVSEYDALYARSALSESDAALFFLVGVWLWLIRGTETRKGSSAWLLLAGLLFGTGFTANYRLIVYIAAVVVVDLVRSWRVSGAGAAARSAAIWAAGLAFVPLLWQIAGLTARAHGLSLFESEITGRPTSYLQEALYQLHGGKQAAIRFNPALYLEWYAVRQGPVLLALTVAGLALAALRRSFAWLAAATPVALPFAVYTFAPFIVPRNLVPALPFASILAAATVAGLSRLAPRLTLTLAALTVVLAAGMTWRLTGIHSGFAQASSYLQAHGSSSALTTTEVMVFYLRAPSGSCHAPPVPPALSSLSPYVRSGYRYAVLDNHHTSPVTRYIRRHARRVARFPASGSVSLGESLISSENSAPPGTASSAEHVDVYWLGGLHLPSGARGSVAPCSVGRIT